jgi:lysophospholipase L1-like esterase
MSISDKKASTNVPRPIRAGRGNLGAIYLFLFLFLFACTNTHPTLSRLPDDAVILAFGDSLTSGVGAPPESSYPEILESLIQRKVIGSGIPGETSDEGLVRLPGELSTYKPRLVVLCLGGNDLLRKMDLEKTASNLSRMVQIIRDSGAEVMLIGVPRPGLVLSTARFYKNISEDMGVPLEGSLFADILADSKLRADPIHPNAEGYQRLAEGIADFLRKTGALP